MHEEVIRKEDPRFKDHCPRCSKQFENKQVTHILNLDTGPAAVCISCSQAFDSVYGFSVYFDKDYAEEKGSEYCRQEASRIMAGFLPRVQ